jgi:hypothetical protein
MWQAIGTVALVLFTLFWGRIVWRRLRPGPEDDFDSRMTTGFYAWIIGITVVGTWWALILRLLGG